MRKSILLFTILFILLMQGLSAQSFPTFDQNPVWTVYSIRQSLPAVIEKVTLGADTLINMDYWNPIRFLDQNDSLLWAPGFIHQNSDKVYFRFDAPDLNESFLIYDFSVQQGDSIKVFANENFEYKYVEMVVEKVDSMEFESIMRKVITLKRINIDPRFSYKYQWIEGIGSPEGPSYLFTCPWGGCEFIPRLSCLFTDRGLQYSTNRSFCLGQEEGIIYVNAQSSSGINDGTSWLNAYRSLQSALADAEYGNQVWVAAGTYLPDSLNDRLKSFVIPAGVKVYGGFAGTEESLEDRAPEANPTILSGNIGAAADSTDNSYHVVYLSNPDSNTLLDGLTIISGFALGHPDGTDADVGGGIRIEVTEEGSSGWPVIANCRFQNNTGRRGGAISARSADTLSSGLQINNCLFEKNTATSFGGAVYVKTEQEGTITSRIEACRFMSNSSGHMGGALYFSDVSGKMSLKDNTFFQNFAPTMGGAIGIVQEDHNGNYWIENADFSDNISLGEGGAINFVCEKPLDSQLEIQGSDFTQNRSLNASGGALNIVNFGGTIHLRVNRSNFTENETSQDGAAISFYDELFGTSDIRVTNSRIENNRVSAFTGAAYFYNQEFVRRGSGNQTVFYNTLFAYNDGAYSYLGSSSGANDTYIYNCTFYDNGNQPIVNWSRIETNTQINVLHIWVKNSIIWEPGETSLEDMLLSIASGGGTILYDYQMDHNLISARNCEAGTDIYACGGNNLFSQDPQLRDPIRGDFRPKPCSPAINAGTMDELLDELNEGFDLSANARILEDIPDIGAYETASFEFEVEAAQLPDCPGGEDGRIQFSTPPDIAFTIRWETGMNATGQLEGLASGDYQFTLTTNDGCTYTLPYTLAGPDTMQLTYTITPASGPDSRDGGISLGTIRGGTGPHRVQLFRGDRAVNLGGLAPGTYELRVTDRNGCMISEEIVISFVSDVVNLEYGGQLKAFPNPVRRGQEVRLEWEGTEEVISELRLLDPLGRTLQVDKPTAGRTPRFSISTEYLEPGWYLLQVRRENSGILNLRLVVK